jgi:hypothetical protein
MFLFDRTRASDRRALRVWVPALLSIAVSASAEADPAPSAPPTQPDSAVETEVTAADRAREAFLAGADFVKESDWARALESFNLSHELRPHPTTRYNIGVAQRALGQYVAAQASLKEAVAIEEGETLPLPLREQAQALLQEIEGIVSTVSLEVTPADATLAIDGRPLEKSGDRWLAGIRAAGKGERIEGGKAELVLDPGAHVFVFSRRGFADAVVNKTFTPGSTQRLTLSLDTLPATIHVEASREEARVTVDGIDVGYAPVDVPRPGGTYVVEVSKPGYVTFSTRVSLDPGAASSLRAPLPVYEPPLTEEVWFWSVIGSGVALVGAGVAVGTYLATREPPTAPAPSGGTIGWVIDLR